MINNDCEFYILYVFVFKIRINWFFYFERVVGKLLIYVCVVGGCFYLLIEFNGMLFDKVLELW